MPITENTWTTTKPNQGYFTLQDRLRIFALLP